MSTTLLVDPPPVTIWYQWREQGNTLHIELLKAAPDVRPRKEANAGCSYSVPDFLVEMTSGQKRLVEVKPSDRLTKPLAQRKLSVARQYAATEGWAFHLVTEKELLEGPLLSNVQLVGRYRQATTDPVLLQTIQRSVCEHGVPLADLCRQADQSDSTRARMHVFQLLAVGDLSFDPRQEAISDQTLLKTGTGSDQDDRCLSQFSETACRQDERRGPLPPPASANPVLRLRACPGGSTASALLLRPDARPARGPVSPRPGYRVSERRDHVNSPEAAGRYRRAYVLARLRLVQASPLNHAVQLPGARCRDRESKMGTPC